jgi:hypothetical protein
MFVAGAQEMRVADMPRFRARVRPEMIFTTSQAPNTA